MVGYDTSSSKKRKKRNKTSTDKTETKQSIAVYFLEKNRQKSKNLANQSCKFNTLQLSQLRQ